MSDSLVRVSRRVGWGAHWPMPRSRVCLAGHADGARHVLDRIDGIPSNERSVRASAVDAARIDPHPEPSGGPANRRSASDRGASTVSPRTNDPSGLRPSMQPASIRTPSRAADRLTAVPHPTEVHRRPPSASLPAISSTL
ncbi:unnamed protein product [Musa banksii]